MKKRICDFLFLTFMITLSYLLYDSNLRRPLTANNDYSETAPESFSQQARYNFRSTISDYQFHLIWVLALSLPVYLFLRKKFFKKSYQS